MDARDLERQRTLLALDADASSHVYRQGLLRRHAHIDLRHAMRVVALKPRKIVLAYAHNDLAVLVAAAGAGDTVAAVEAKR